MKFGGTGFVTITIRILKNCGLQVTLNAFDFYVNLINEYQTNMIIKRV